MRLNKYIAQATGVSRREADRLISAGGITVNGEPAKLGLPVNDNDAVMVDGEEISLPTSFTYLLVNKPVGYVSTRNSQDGTLTIYELLPEKYQRLKYIGRLDKNSSGALLMTDDGDFAHQLTHPSFRKEKFYEVKLQQTLKRSDLDKINAGVKLPDGMSKMNVAALRNTNSESRTTKYEITMHEGRNRQIRRTFGALGYEVLKLHRTKFGPYELGDLKSGEFIEVKKREV